MQETKMDMETRHDKSHEPEGELTRKVEEYTARVPSLAYVGLAMGSVLLSASIATFTRKKSFANFVGLWAPTLMLIGVYNKLVKMEEAAT